MEYIFTLMELDTKVIGKMIYSMDMAKKLGQMDHYTKVNILEVKNMVLAYIHGMMVQDMKENGLKIRLEDLVLTLGLMAENIKDSGQITIWKVLVSIHGQTEGDMKVSIRMIKNMALVFIHGLTKDNIREFGIKENSMHQEYIMFQEVKANSVYGKMEKGQNGLMDKQLKIQNQEELITLDISKNKKVFIQLTGTYCLVDLVDLMRP